MPRFTGSDVSIEVQTANLTPFAVDIAECSSEDDIIEAITEVIQQRDGSTEDDLDSSEWDLLSEFGVLTIAQLSTITHHESDAVEAAFDLGVTSNNAIGLLENNDYYQHKVPSYRRYVEEHIEEIREKIPSVLYGNIDWEGVYNDLTSDLSIGTAKNGSEYVFRS